MWHFAVWTNRRCFSLNKGAYFAYLGDNKKSIQYYRKSLSIAEKIKDWELIGDFYQAGPNQKLIFKKL
jgi:hypothetical protein